MNKIPSFFTVNQCQQLMDPLTGPHSDVGLQEWTFLHTVKRLLARAPGVDQWLRKGKFQDRRSWKSPRLDICLTVHLDLRKYSATLSESKQRTGELNAQHSPRFEFNLCQTKCFVHLTSSIPICRKLINFCRSVACNLSTLHSVDVIMSWK